MRRNMKQRVKFICLLAACIVFGADSAFAQEGAASLSYLPIGAGIAMGFAALGGTLGQGKAISAGLESIGRNPAAQGKIFIPMLVCLAFIESLVIFSFVIAFSLLPK